MQLKDERDKIQTDLKEITSKSHLNDTIEIDNILGFNNNDIIVSDKAEMELIKDTLKRILKRDQNLIQMKKNNLNIIHECKVEYINKIKQ